MTPAAAARLRRARAARARALPLAATARARLLPAALVLVDRRVGDLLRALRRAASPARALLDVVGLPPLLARVGTLAAACHTSPRSGRDARAMPRSVTAA